MNANPGVWLVVLGTLIGGCERSAMRAARETTPMTPLFQELVDAATARDMAMLHVPHHLSDGEIDMEAVAARVRQHPDYTSSHLLLLLRRHAPDVYDIVPLQVKADILCSTLAAFEWMNDFGYLHPGGSYDDLAARELLRTGSAALPRLIELLDDRTEVYLEGSEVGVYRYRRADFAYRYVMLILGRGPAFHVEVPDRDRAIATLKKNLAAN